METNLITNFQRLEGMTKLRLNCSLEKGRSSSTRVWLQEAITHGASYHMRVSHCKLTCSV